ncbi:MAG: type II toxin-antitoxin system RelE/ParE family toxin [Chloroflexi bacterium]|nr:MAG: type II toxin-antitoxin system RelE/ParE family toxin [Chloroflexota bacterium]RLC84561.1 MAG: type II toxin-antitoxin system RelE/ParE family toxin [Chloroflexota bacterium]HEY68203.1 type II toxin-antitoxin system RelE/ParE family toxin [Thermoflexia bacterium]
MYEIWLTRDAQKFYQAADDPLTTRLNRCFDQLRRNPYRHPNIKRLKGPLAGHWRYRVGDWRVVYRVDEDKQVITVVLIVHRSKAYR